MNIIQPRSTITDFYSKSLFGHIQYLLGKPKLATIRVIVVYWVLTIRCTRKAAERLRVWILKSGNLDLNVGFATHCVTLGKLFNLSNLGFLICKMRIVPSLNVDVRVQILLLLYLSKCMIPWRHLINVSSYDDDVLCKHYLIITAHYLIITIKLVRERVRGRDGF